MPALGVETSINNKRKIESSLLDEANTSWNQLQLCEYTQPYAQGFHHQGGWISFSSWAENFNNPWQKYLGKVQIIFFYSFLGIKLSRG